MLFNTITPCGIIGSQSYINNSQEDIVEAVKLSVTETMDIEFSNIIKKTRKRKVIYARHCFRSKLKEFTVMSLKAIARISGHAHHATIINSVQRWSDLIETQKQYRNMDAKINTLIYSKLTSP